jgi:DMSO reductase anchor subunit
MRTLVLGLALGFTALLAFLTFFVLFTSGPDVLVVVSLLVLAIIGFGVLGALAHPPSDR